MVLEGLQVPAGRHDGRGLRSVRRRGGTLLGALVIALGPVACGFEVQTNQPYTPEKGVNVDAGPASSVKIRNLMVVSRAPGEGFLSATMTVSQEDALTGVMGAALKPDGTPGTPLTVTVANPVELGEGALVVLTDRPLITVKSADLLAGLEAQVVLQFREVGEVTTTAPVVDGNQPEFQTISASPSPSS